jgi:hypothetical protein
MRVRQDGIRLTSKMVIDATRYNAKSFPSVSLPMASAMDEVEKNWDRYGIRCG